VFSIQLWGWRQTYFGTAIFVLLTIPLVLQLLKGHQIRHANLLNSLNDSALKGTKPQGHTRRQMLSDVRFYLMLPSMIAPSLILTAIFFFPTEIAKAKGWSSLWVTGNYWAYSAATVATVISTGTLVDRYTARRVVPPFLLPLAVALIVLTISNHHFMVWPFMLLMGLSSGLYFTGFSALWAELYGTKHLGAIKSVINAVMVFSSSLGPALVGILLTRGVAFEQICMILASGCLIASVMLFYALRRSPHQLFY
jgi:predicted MFS family arabinose efflux permease